METTFYTEWVRAGQMSIANYFIKHYKVLKLTAEEAIFTMMLFELYHGTHMTLDFKEIGERLAIDENQVFKHIQSLLQKKCLSISPKKNQQGMVEDSYSLEPLFGQLEIHYNEQKKTEASLKNNDILSVIQTEFGRSLSPIELQTVSSWLDEDKYSIDLIMLALKEAVLNQAFNLNYMDRILLTWQRKGFHTPTQVLNDKRKYQQVSPSVRQLKQIEGANTPEIPIVNWVNPKQ